MNHIPFILNSLNIPIVLLTSILLSTIYLCLVRRWTYFSRQNVKCVRGLPFLGAHYPMILRRTPFIELFRKHYRDFPTERLIGIYELGGVPVYMIRDPELIQQITIKDFDHFTNHRFAVHETTDPIMGRALFTARDQKWRALRTAVSPAFTGVKMRAMLSLAVDVIKNRLEYLQQNATATAVYNMRDLNMRIIGDTIASCAFGIEVNSIKDRDNDFFESGSKMGDFTGLKGLTFFAYGTMPKLMNLLQVKMFKDEEYQYFRGLVKDLVEYRERHNVVRGDMINMLMEAKKVKAASASPTISKVSDDDLFMQPLMFFFGGFSSISLTTGFLFHELAMHPAIQDRLYREIKQVDGNLGGAPLSYDCLAELKFLDAVLSETMRFWSIAPATDRMVNKAYAIENSDGTKVQLNVGDAVWLPLDAIARDEKYFADPHRFIPERFLPENRQNLPTNVFLPFGCGPRICVASRFAVMKCKAMVYYVLLYFRLEKCAKTQDPIKLSTRSAFVEPDKGFWLQLRRRKLQ